MSSISSSILYLILALACISSSYHSLVDCDQPVFVLETSDSSESSPSQSAPIQSFVPSTPTSATGSNKREIDNHKSNTQIITDDSAAPNAAPSSNIHNTSSPSSSHVVVIERHHATTHSPVVSQSSTHKKHQEESQEHSQLKQQPLLDQQSHNQVSQPLKQAKLQRDSPTVRRLDESPAPSQRATNTRNALPQTRPRSTTSAPYTGEDQSSVPKSEERLLISITSEEDEYKPPQRQVIASTGGFDEVQPTTSYSQQPQQHKKKPAITISIQDNSNKQGGSGTPSVILRPSENGQSIIISTLGSSDIQSNNHDNNNKYNPNKPAIAIVSSGGHLSNNNNNNNNNEPPYREPVVDPVQSSGSHHNIHPSTHRPTINNNNEYNPPANRPIVSTLLDQPRPPVNVLGTQRPQVVSLNEDYEPSRPSTSSPIHSRPTSQPGYNNNENVGPQGGFGGGDIPTTGSSGGGSKYPLNEKSCGVIHETRIVGGDEADPNDFLWMAAIIKSKPTDGEVKPFCGGSLITRRHILTAAHCLDGLAPRDVLVRLGSYDFDDSTASPLSNDYAIDQFRKPSQYNKKTHVADIAIMRLKTPLQTSDNYRTVCMPQARRSYVGALGTVTGYGSQSQTFRRAAPKLRQVTVPIWENRKCSAVYKKNLTESFLCAGYEEGGKDACQGDSGGPLMTEGPQERTIVVGVVSHGIGCGSPGYPGVYTRTSTFLDWIEENTRE